MTEPADPQLDGALDIRLDGDAHVIKPGDTVILRVAYGLTPERAEYMTRSFAQHLPGVKVLMVEGVDAVEIYRPTVEPTDDFVTQFTNPSMIGDTR